jgi:hypothetical protein
MWRRLQQHEEEWKSCTREALLLAPTSVQAMEKSTIVHQGSIVGRDATDYDLGSIVSR